MKIDIYLAMYFLLLRKYRVAFCNKKNITNHFIPDTELSLIFMRRIENFAWQSRISTVVKPLSSCNT